MSYLKPIWTSYANATGPAKWSIANEGRRLTFLWSIVGDGVKLKYNNFGVIDENRHSCELLLNKDKRKQVSKY